MHLRAIIVISVLMLFFKASANESHDHAAEPEAPPAHEKVEAEPVDPDLVEIRVTDNPDEIRVPSDIWEHVTSEPKSHYIFVPAAVILQEKNPGVLKQPKVKILFPRGGGAIDLSQFVTNKPGSFFVKFEFERGALKENQRIFFISQARKRKVDGEIYGVGCKKYMDVLDGVQRVSKKEGILVNTTRNRHLSILGGTFLFASVQNREVLLSQISFKDSTHPEYFCESVAKENMNEPVESL